MILRHADVWQAIDQLATLLGIGQPQQAHPLAPPTPDVPQVETHNMASLDLAEESGMGLTDD